MATGRAIRRRVTARKGADLVVPVKLLREAHAVMRACGWQLAPASDTSEDPTLAAAAAEIEQAFRDLLAKGTS